MMIVRKPDPTWVRLSVEVNFQEFIMRLRRRVVSRVATVACGDISDD
jgi:hypothetical protein